MRARNRYAWLSSTLAPALVAGFPALGTCAVGCSNGAGAPGGGWPGSDAASDGAPGPDAAADAADDAGGGRAPDASPVRDSGSDGGVASLGDGGPDAAPPLTGPVYTFGTALNPGSCLDVLGAGTAGGTQIDEYTCNTTVAQSFYVVGAGPGLDGGGGAVTLVNTNSKACVDVGDGGAAGAKAQLEPCDGTAAQTFDLESAGNGFFNIVNTGSSKCLGVAGGNPANLTDVVLDDCDAGAAVQWNPAPVGAGYTATCGVAQLQAGRVLAANCSTTSQSLSSTMLDLNSCLTNSNGVLAWQANGGFANSCSNCQLTAGATLTCQCQPVSGSSVSTTIDLSSNISNCDGVLTCGPCGTGTTTSGPTVLAGLYCADGNDCYQFSGASTFANLKESGWNVLFVFAFSVQASGDITAGSTPIVQNGVYVGDPSWGSNVAALKTPPTTVTRYEVTVGGYGDTSYSNIESLVASQGTGSGSILYKNFQALKTAVPGIDAINDDDEQTYDVNSSTAFGQMIIGLGMKYTLVPYQNQSFWVQLKNNLGAGCDMVYLQCYEGGAGNDPGNWDSAFGNGFHVVPGQESNTQSASTWSSWATTDGITGGFYYPDVVWAPGANWGVLYMANAIGLPPL
jgi:hypothetical protein